MVAQVNDPGNFVFPLPTSQCSSLDNVLWEDLGYPHLVLLPQDPVDRASLTPSPKLLAQWAQ